MNTNPGAINWPETAIHHLADAVVAMDGGGVIRYINPAAEKFANSDAHPVVGKPASMVFQFREADSRKPLTLPDAAAVSEHAGPVVFTRVLLTILAPLPRQERIVNAVFSAARDHNDKANGVVMRFRDVTETVQHDRDMWDEQKIVAISSMAGSIAGEFSNWLGLISGHAAAILDNLIPRTRAYEEAVRILDTTRHAAGLTRRLMSVARAGEKNGDVPGEGVDLAAIVRNAVGQAKASMGQPNVEYRIKPCASSPAVLAEGVQLVDCLLNIFRNSIEAMPEGGVITVDMPASSDPSKKPYAILRIRDTGVGMSKDDMRRAFTPFFTTKPPGAAIGLGLTVVQTSVEHWGGRVEIRSRAGHGTSVRIFLKRADHDRLHDNRRTQRLPTASILAVDDNAAILDEICAVLEPAGFLVHRAHDAATCFSIYQKRATEINLAIIDVIMPGKDGRDILSEILKINPQASIIMMSGFSRDYVRGYLKAGAWAFVQKPIDPAHLLATVRRMLKQE